MLVVAATLYNGASASELAASPACCKNLRRLDAALPSSDFMAFSCNINIVVVMRAGLPAKITALRPVQLIFHRVI
jgi:hypothetical protein